MQARVRQVRQVRQVPVDHSAKGRLFGAMVTSGEAQEHFRLSRLELLKGIRRVVDDRIEKASRTDQPRGSGIVVE